MADAFEVPGEPIEPRPAVRYRLFRSKSTGAWIPYAQNTGYATPAQAYIPELAQRFNVAPADVEVVELDAMPDDFESKSLTEPVTAEQTEREEARALALPSPAEIDALVNATFADWKPDQRAFLKRLAKLIRALSLR